MSLSYSSMMDDDERNAGQATWRGSERALWRTFRSRMFIGSIIKFQLAPAASRVAVLVRAARDNRRRRPVFGFAAIYVDLYVQLQHLH